jgi:DNA-binding CsgD family transcriptional regulator
MDGSTGSPEGEMLDLIYGAAFEPDLWVKVMHRLADRIGGEGGAMTQFNMHDGGGAIVLSRLDDAVLPKYFNHFATRNPLSNVDDAYAYLKTWQPRILTDEDWMPKEALVRSEYYNDFLVPQDIHSTVMIRLGLQGANVSAISLNRSKRRPQYSREDLRFAAWAHPHMIRAFNLGQKFAEARQFTTDLTVALERSDHGMFVLESDGRVRFANRAAEALAGPEGPLRLMGGQLTATDADAARKLVGLIRLATAGAPDQRRGGSMALGSATRRLPLSVTVAPLPGERISIFEARPCAIVCVTDLEAGAAPPEQKLRALFGLTQAETRVALALFEGATPREAAEQLGVSFHTVRAQLARIFDKTGVNRQSDLVRVMMRSVGVGFE